MAFDEMRERLKKRTTFLLRKPLLAGSNPADQKVDSDVDALIEAKKKEWRAAGYTENQANMAINLAREWANSMTTAFAPPELRSAVFKHNLEKGFTVAEHWLRGLLGQH
jgi:hypothetical protein